MAPQAGFEPTTLRLKLINSHSRWVVLGCFGINLAFPKSGPTSVVPDRGKSLGLGLRRARPGWGLGYVPAAEGDGQLRWGDLESFAPDQRQSMPLAVPQFFPQREAIHHRDFHEIRLV